MFRGATLVNLDSKGRLAVPTRYREGLIEDAAGQLVCTIDIHHPCLLLYPLPEWEVIEQKLSRLSSMNPVERRVQRLLLGHASECQMDNAGSLLIAPVLRQHAGLTKEGPSHSSGQPRHSREMQFFRAFILPGGIFSLHLQA